MVNADGSITYTPNVGWRGAETFGYTVTDNGTTNGAADPKTATGTVKVFVTEVIEDPSTTDDPKTATEDTPLSFSAGSLSGNDSSGPGS